MIDKNKIAIIIATLALVGVFGVAMFGGKTVIKEIVGGTTNYDVLEADEVAFKTASTTNIRIEYASSTPFVGAKRLYIGSGQRMDSYYNDSGYPLNVFVGAFGFNSGTASSSFRVNLFATTTGPATIASLYSFTALTEAINGSDTFLSRNFIYATSTTATTTNTLALQKVNSGSGMITIPASGYLHFFVQQGDLLGSCTAGGQAGKCESATSTARGFGDMFARVLYIRDIY